MVKIENSMKTILILANLMLFSFCKHPTSEVNHIDSPSTKIASIWQQTRLVAGTRDQVDQRALLFMDLFRQSKGNFEAAQLLAHLSLATENLSYPVERIEMCNINNPSCVTDSEKWGAQLRQTNKEIAELIYFHFELARLKIPLVKVSSFEIENNLNDTTPLREIFTEIFSAVNHNKNLSNKKKSEHTEKILSWIELYKPKRVIDPKEVQQSYIAKLCTGEIAQLSSCFAETTKPKACQTEEIRKKTLLAFSAQLKTVDFSPKLECFKKSKYLSRFPENFYNEHNIFIKHYIQHLAFPNNDSTPAWIYHQWQKLHVTKQIALPNTAVPISSEDKTNLKMDSDPLQRNLKINESYFQIGERLSQCIGVRKNIGNWYHFAAWASVSARDVINGNKLLNMNPFTQSGIRLAILFGFIPTEDSLKQTFAEVNNMIAIEMIPLGRVFLKTFCSEKPSTNFKSFSHQYLKQKTKYEKFLFNAFKGYFEALTEKVMKRKIELITFASINHVLGEQTRVDNRLQAAFYFGANIKKIKDSIYPYILTGYGDLRLGSHNPQKFSLIENVSTSYLSPDLKEISLVKDFKIWNDSLGIPNILNDMKTIPNSAARDWSNLEDRFRFLTAFFRANITAPMLREDPNYNLK